MVVKSTKYRGSQLSDPLHVALCGRDDDGTEWEYRDEVIAMQCGVLYE